MAIAACFAGPLFNLLMGLSMGLAAATAMHGTISGIRLENELVVLSVCLVGTRFWVRSLSHPTPHLHAVAAGGGRRSLDTTVSTAPLTHQSPTAHMYHHVSCIPQFKPASLSRAPL